MPIVCRPLEAKRLFGRGSLRFPYLHFRSGVYVILYLPEGAEPELFGPVSTYQSAVNLLRSLAAAAGGTLDAPPSGLMASVDIAISGEHHRYQLLKMASTTQLEVHASVIEELGESAEVKVIHPDDISPPGRFSGY